MRIMDKVFLFRISESDKVKYPLGEYYIEKDSKQVFMIPRSKLDEKISINIKPIKPIKYIPTEYTAILFGFFLIFAMVVLTLILSIAATAIPVIAIILLEAFVENDLMIGVYFVLLGVILALFILFGVVLILLAIISKKRTQEEIKLEETKLQLAFSSKKEEEKFLRFVAKKLRWFLIIYFSSIVLTALFGYLVVVLAPMMPSNLYLVPLMAFVISAAIFSVFSFFIKRVATTSIALKRK